MPLKRILGAPTAWCIGMGVAIGSGIFRTPGDIAVQLSIAAYIAIQSPKDALCTLGLLVGLAGLYTPRGLK